MKLGVWYIIVIIVVAAFVAAGSAGGVFGNIMKVGAGIGGLAAFVLSIWIFIRGGFTCQN